MARGDQSGLGCRAAAGGVGALQRVIRGNNSKRGTALRGCFEKLRPELLCSPHLCGLLCQQLADCCAASEADLAHRLTRHHGVTCAQQDNSQQLSHKACAAMHVASALRPPPLMPYYPPLSTPSPLNLFPSALPTPTYGWCVPQHHVQHPVRQPRPVSQLSQGQGSQGGQLSRLQHNRAAGSDGRGHLRCGTQPQPQQNRSG